MHEIVVKVPLFHPFSRVLGPPPHRQQKNGLTNTLPEGGGSPPLPRHHQYSHPWELDPLPLMHNHPPRITDSNIESSVITHEGLTTLAHPDRGWTIASGTWNALRETWGLSSETLQKIYDSCITQRQLDSVGQHFHPYKTYPPDDQADLTDRKITRTLSSGSAHLLPHGLEE